MHFNDREEIIALTPQWKGERLPDGRPKVDEKYLKALKTLTLEEVWKPIFVKGYESQFEGRLHTLHDDGRKLIGRAVTATYCPFRPDLDVVTKDIGRSEGRTGTYNQWVIDNLMEYDVPVIDMYDKIYKGTFLGGNLTTALKNKTKNEKNAAEQGSVFLRAKSPEGGKTFRARFKRGRISTCRSPRRSSDPAGRRGPSSSWSERGDTCCRRSR